MTISRVQFSTLLTCSPVNKMAHIVTSQRGCDDVYRPVDTDELVQIYARLCRKQRLLKRVLQIETKAQHRNTVTRFRKGMRQARDLVGQRAMKEYALLSEQIFQIQCELAERRKVRRYVAQAETVYKQMANEARA